MKTYTKWSELKAKMSPEAQRKAKSLTEEMLAKMRAGGSSRTATRARASMSVASRK